MPPLLRFVSSSRFLLDSAIEFFSPMLYRIDVEANIPEIVVVNGLGFFQPIVVLQTESSIPMALQYRVLQLSELQQPTKILPSPSKRSVVLPLILDFASVVQSIEGTIPCATTIPFRSYIRHR